MSDEVQTEAPIEVQAPTEAVAAPEPTTTNEAPAPKVEAAPTPPRSLAKFTKTDGTIDVAKLEKSYLNLEKKLNEKLLNLAPESVDEYQYDFGEGYQVDAERTTAFKEAARSKGFTPDQYAFVMETYKNLMGESTWTAEKAEATLKEQWAGDFESNTASAQRAFEEFAPSDASPNDPVWNHPAVMKLLARIGGELGEDSFIGKGTGSKEPQMTEAEVKALIASKDYWNNKETQEKVTAWYAKRYS